MILKILTAKALFASATIGVSGIALAATGSLPAPVQHAVAAVTSQVGIHIPDASGDGENHAGSSGVSGVTGEDNSSGASGVTGTTGPTGPPSKSRADRALCHALVSGRGAERGGKMGAEAFDRLRERATLSGASVAQYCETISTPPVDPSGVTGVSDDQGDDNSVDQHESGATGVSGPKGSDTNDDRHGDDTTPPPAPTDPTGIEGSSGVWYPTPAPYIPEGPSGPSGDY